MTNNTDADEIIIRLSGHRKIVINAGYGGFGLSDEAIELYATLSGLNLIQKTDDDNKFYAIWYLDEVNDSNHWMSQDIPRDDKNLIKVVETLGERAFDNFATLKIIEIPADISWHIADYDGWEWVAEDHRTWR